MANKKFIEDIYVRDEEFYDEHWRWKTCPACGQDELCMMIDFNSNRWFVMCDNCGAKTPPRFEKAQAWHDMKDEVYTLPKNKSEPEEELPETDDVELFEDDGVEVVNETGEAIKMPHKKGKARK